MERFPNFPQTIDPVESETILEQFLELNNNVEKINQGYNEIAPQVDTNTTDIAQLKTQVSESGTRVKVNGQLVAEWSPDVLSSDVATNRENIEQIRLAQSSDSLAIVALQSDNITNKNNIMELQGDVSELNQESARALKTPISAPNTIELVGVDSTNSQVMISILDLFPIGTIIQSTENVSPASYIGGTWEQLKDRFLLGAGDTYSNGTTGGEATHKLTVSEMPSHDHTIHSQNTPTTSHPYGGNILNYYGYSTTYQDLQYAMGSTGGNQAHNNMPPYLVVYMWKRVG